MTIDRRKFLVISGTALSTTHGMPTHAQTFPTKPVTIIVGFTAGGPVDITARTISDPLSKLWGQAVIVDVRPGANGSTGAAMLASAPPDGHTLLMGTRSMTMNAALYKKLPYDPSTAFSPIAIGARQPTVLVVSNQLGIRSLPDLVKRLKTDPDRYSYASTGNGSIPHLAAALFQKLTDTRINHIPYKGGSAFLADLTTGRVDMSFATLATVIGQIQNNQVIPLALAAEKRSSTLPDVPTFAEAGIQDMSVDTWYGLLAPAGTPSQLIQKMNSDINSVLVRPDIRAKLEKAGLTTSLVSADEYRRQYNNDILKYGKLIRELNLSLD